MSLNRESCLMAAFNKYPDISYMHSHREGIKSRNSLHVPRGRELRLITTLCFKGIRYWWDICLIIPCGLRAKSEVFPRHKNALTFPEGCKGRYILLSRNTNFRLSMHTDTMV